MNRTSYFSVVVAVLATIILLGSNSFNVKACDATDLPDAYVNFIENKGQWQDNIQYQVEMNMARMYLESDRITYLLLNPEDMANIHDAHHDPELDITDLKIDCHAFNVHFNNANPDLIAESSCLMDNYRNYFVGNDPDKWAGHVGLYRQIDYYNMYEGIDLRFYGVDGNIKYDFIIAPTADANQIEFEYEGVDDLFIADDNLHIVTSVNTIVEQKPYAYQYISGQLTEVAAAFVITDNKISFSFPDGYDASEELIIDPELIFSTYSGATSDNWGFTATHDEEGNLYAGGAAFGVGYPTTTGAFQVDFAGGDLGGTYQTDMSITKFSADGTSQLYSTFLGGGISNEMPHSLIVTPTNELIILGSTGSDNYPVTTGAIDETFNGGAVGTSINNIAYSDGSDIVVTKLSADGDMIIGSTYFGGIGNDGLNTSTNLKYNYADESRGEVFLDPQGNIYIASTTSSPDFPTTTGALQPFYGGGSQDGCVAKFNADLTEVIWSSYVGGSDDDATYSLKLDGEGVLYIAGGTSSIDFVTTSGAVNESYQGGVADAYVVKLSNDGGSLIASTFLGTAFYDQSYFVDIDQDGFVYTIGQTAGDYPLEGDAAYVIPNSGQFIHKMNNDLTSTEWSTVFGTGNGTPDISPTAFQVDECYRLYVSGWGGNVNGAVAGSTTTGLEITSDALQSTTEGSDFYFMVLGADASTLDYATYFGSPSGTGEHVDGGTSRFSKNGFIYQAVCAGCGGNQTFPTSQSAWSESNNSTNCNLGAVKFQFDNPPTVADFIPPPPACAPYTAEFINTSVNADDYLWDFGDGSELSDAVDGIHTYEEAGIYEVSLVAIKPGTCNGEDDLVLTLEVLGSVDAEITAPSFCPGDSPAALEASVEGGVWSGDGVSDEETGLFDPTDLATGEYEVSYTVGEADCPAVVTALVVINAALTIELTDPPACLNDGTDAYAFCITITGDGEETVTLGDALAEVGEIPVDEEFCTTLTGGDGSELTISALGDEIGCEGSLTIVSPVCPECNPDAGVMTSDLQDVCANGTVSATTSDEFVDIGQVLGYILHNSASADYGTILGQNLTGEFTFADLTGANYNTTYYISAVVGYPDDTGFPLLDDECSDINAGAPVLFIAPISLDVDEYCDFTTGEFYVRLNISGGYPEYDGISTYTVVGDYAGTPAYGDDVLVVFPEGTASSFSFMVSGICGSEVIGDDFYCEKTPVELIRFTVTVEEKGNLVQWATASETNNDFFSIERSDKPNGPFEVIDKIAGAGNSITTLNYEYTDKTAACGTFYYRLRQTDVDGTTSVSATVNVQRNNAHEGVVVTPIPATNQVSLSFVVTSNQSTINVYATNGRLVSSKTIETPVNNNCSFQYQLPITNLLSGVYLVQIVNNKQVQSTKFVKR